MPKACFLARRLPMCKYRAPCPPPPMSFMKTSNRFWSPRISLRKGRKTSRSRGNRRRSNYTMSCQQWRRSSRNSSSAWRGWKTTSCRPSSCSMESISPKHPTARSRPQNQPQAECQTSTTSRRNWPYQCSGSYQDARIPTPSPRCCRTWTNNVSKATMIQS